MSANEAQDVASEPLLCVLGWHNADPLALWNDGHYFSNCSRCGRDLVRTAFGRWTVPKGVQVVWSAQPPHGREPVRLSPDKDASARRTRIEFPIAEPAGIAGEVEAAAEKRMAVEDVPVMFAPEATESESTEVEAWNGLPISLDLRRSTRWARPAEPARSDERRIAMAGELPIQQVPRTLHDDAAPPQMRAADEPLTWFPDLEQDDEPYVLRTNFDAAFADAVPEEARSRDEPSSEPEDEAGSIASLAVRSAPYPEAAPSRLIIPDFMNEASFEIAYDLQTGRIMSPEERERAKAAVAKREAAACGLRKRLQDLGTSARAYLQPRRAPTPMEKGVGERLQVLLERHAGLAAATVFGAFVLAAVLIEGSAERPTSASPASRLSLATSPTPASVSTSAFPPMASTAFVTASLLNCRAAAPAENAPTVRRLTRGAPVQVLSADPGWVSVAHRGRQCWMAARFLSTAKPL